jgi:FKBP-type peptidyl-prolyl cis-trans isomerase SlpA
MSSDSEIPISAGCSVNLHFSLALDNGEEIDSNFDAAPASLKLGDGNMLPGFEQALIGMKAGEFTKTLLSPEQAFGEINSKNVQHFPADKFRNLLSDDLLPVEVGLVISFKDPAGFDLPGVVQSITKDTVTVDFNHPLAGKSIVFSASIISVISPDAEAVEVKL